MNKTKKYAKWTVGIGFLMIAGSLLHLPHWVASAAAIFSQPVSNVKEAYRRPYQEMRGISCSFPTAPGCSGTIVSDVPAGYQLVIDHISVVVPTGTTVTSISAQLSGSFSNPYVSFPLASGGDNSGSVPQWTATQSTKVVVASGTAVNIAVTGQDSGQINFASGFFQAMVTGYLEACGAFTGGTCPTIMAN